MTPEQQVPTINEIVARRDEEERDRRFNTRTTLAFTRYLVGEIVVFMFNGLERVGRITHAICRAGVTTYHIDTEGGGWYREIDEQSIRKPF